MVEKPIANPSIVLREEFDDWALLYNPNSGEAYGMNPVGVYVWKRLDGAHTLDLILTELRADCESVPESAVGEIRTFIDDLVSKGLAGTEF